MVSAYNWVGLSLLVSVPAHLVSRSRSSPREQNLAAQLSFPFLANHHHLGFLLVFSIFFYSLVHNYKYRDWKQLALHFHSFLSDKQEFTVSSFFSVPPLLFMRNHLLHSLFLLLFFGLIYNSYIIYVLYIKYIFYIIYYYLDIIFVYYLYIYLSTYW